MISYDQSNFTCPGIWPNSPMWTRETISHSSHHHRDEITPYSRHIYTVVAYGCACMRTAPRYVAPKSPDTRDTYVHRLSPLDLQRPTPGTTLRPHPAFSHNYRDGSLCRLTWTCTDDRRHVDLHRLRVITKPAGEDAKPALWLVVVGITGIVGADGIRDARGSAVDDSCGEKTFVDARVLSD